MRFKLRTAQVNYEWKCLRGSDAKLSKLYDAIFDGEHHHTHPARNIQLLK